MKTTETSGRRMAAYRFSEDTRRLLRALAERLTEKDGVRKVTETEVLERLVHQAAKQEKVR